MSKFKVTYCKSKYVYYDKHIMYLSPSSYRRQPNSTPVVSINIVYSLLYQSFIVARHIHEVFTKLKKQKGKLFFSK